MAKFKNVFQIGFTYIGTIVGAGFASGQEILQFFTRFGWMATLTIAFSSLLFVWLGTKLMLLAHELKAKSYEDLNRYLFGDRLGMWYSMFTLVILFGITTVMLAGAGSVFKEYFRLSYQLGLLVTLACAYAVLANGLKAIISVNSFVVPFMLVFSLLIVLSTLDTPQAGNWFHLHSNYSLGKIWTAPFLYTAFNLATAQAVLVPLGSSVRDKSTVYWGGLVGGCGIGLMLLASHFALSARMPDISQFEIPMGQLTENLGSLVQMLFVFLIFSEIFTTYIADIYGLTLQIHQRTGWALRPIILTLLGGSFLVSQIGFSQLLSTLYPLFGMISMAWFVMMVWRNHPKEKLG